ncbi:MAG: nucleotide pyrophosphohydrolase [Clostridiales bacterium]|nr:nucleotide pyrophosphohydrolase [Clostridiales bacterium]
MREFNGKTYTENTNHDFNELLEVVEILRSPNGCEWDRSQTFESMKECLKNESQEVLDAIDNSDYANLCEELGDVMLQVLLNAEIAKEKGLFNFNDVVQVLTEKLIRRHPHVFGDIERPTTPEESLKLWKMVKEKEKALKNRK